MHKGDGPSNGLELLLGDAKTLHLHEQEEVAVDYLKAHRDELRTLAQFPGVKALILGFVFRLPLSATGCAPGPSPKLMLHSLDAGVTPNYYVTLEGRQVESRPVIHTFPKGMPRTSQRWEETPLWKAIGNALTELVRSQALVEDTYHEFIVDRICSSVYRRRKAIAAQLGR